MEYKVYIRKSSEGLEGVEIYLEGTGYKIIAVNPRYQYLSLHKFKYLNKISLLHKLNGPLLKLRLVDSTYSWGMNFGGGVWSTISCSNYYWSDYDTVRDLPEPDLIVGPDFIRRLRLGPEDRQIVRSLFEKIVKKPLRNPSRESKNPFKYMSMYHGRKR